MSLGVISANGVGSIGSPHADPYLPASLPCPVVRPGEAEASFYIHGNQDWIPTRAKLYPDTPLRDFQPHHSRQYLADFVVDDEVGHGVERRFGAVDDDQLGANVLGQQRQARRGLDDK